MGMPPATSSPVLRRRRDEGDTETIPRATPTDPRITWREAFRAVRAETERLAYLFNSYYVAAGPRHARPMRGLITRPDCEQVAAFRAHVDEGIERLLAGADDAQLAEVVRILEIGLHHEQQHQELLLADILHAFAQNPVTPGYDADWRPPPASSSSGEFVALPSGIHGIGFEGEGYCF